MDIVKKQPAPAVSVIIPVYNLDEYLDACLESVEAQTFPNFEAIVVDDGSADCTAEVLRRHAERDERIVAVRTANQGVARARETGIARARGEYICFLDGDDLWEPDMLMRMTAAIGENGGYDIVCCNYKRICRTYVTPVRAPYRGDMTDFDFLEALLCNEIWGGVWGKLYRRQLFETGICHHPLRLWQDVAVNVQIACHRPRVRFIDYVGYGYVQRQESSNHSKLDFDYCRLFCDTITHEIVRHEALLNGRAEYYGLLNNFRTYMIYFCKSSSRWTGDSLFARNLRAAVCVYRTQMKPHFSRAQILLLKLDRSRMMRPVVVALATLLRWRKSLHRRLSH